MKKLLYLFVALFLILFEAIPEGLALGGHKTIAGGFEFIYLAAITVFVYACVIGLNFTWSKPTTSFIHVLIGYVLLRFALFDIVYNLSAGLNLFFIGTTKGSDQIWNWFFDWSGFPPNLFLGLLKFIAFVWGVAWLMEWWDGIKIKK
jgi:hypothetical protein